MTAGRPPRQEVLDEKVKGDGSGARCSEVHAAGSADGRQASLSGPSLCACKALRADSTAHIPGVPLRLARITQTPSKADYKGSCGPPPRARSIIAQVPTGETRVIEHSVYVQHLLLQPTFSEPPAFSCVSGNNSSHPYVFKRPQ